MTAIYPATNFKLLDRSFILVKNTRNNLYTSYPAKRSSGDKK